MAPFHRLNKISLHLSLDDSSQSRSLLPGLKEALVYATPEQRRTWLGEPLYPLVKELEPLQTAKITGMLLQMPTSEIVHLIESPEALKAKVKEAIEVLRNSIPTELQLTSSTKPMDFIGIEVKNGDSTYCWSDCRLPPRAYWENLAYATPEQQRNMLGECLYPLVETLEPLWTAEVTAVLLTLDQSEILHLLESSDALKAKVKEAIVVLSGSWIPQQLQQLMSSIKPASKL
ncbi:unnamed protein product [Arabis nemorensis]|uniref:PABC domain-containing protein n=1 Tax=Arabis nemorensis TaxID=586526 RepID=A0A565BIR4_9BRAS|nr:unnamed protein product [Arabis nemorensis]